MNWMNWILGLVIYCRNSDSISIRPKISETLLLMLLSKIRSPNSIASFESKSNSRWPTLILKHVESLSCILDSIFKFQNQKRSTTQLFMRLRDSSAINDIQNLDWLGPNDNTVWNAMDEICPLWAWNNDQRNHLLLLHKYSDLCSLS